ncbi:MAG: hypothetical protein QOJ65_667 [Fimbriimonadaceae bacterium]|nr:hypothetical protein [Fimbriimonadaceae bacterium]
MKLLRPTTNDQTTNPSAIFRILSGHRVKSPTNDSSAPPLLRASA